MYNKRFSEVNTYKDFENLNWDDIPSKTQKQIVKLEKELQVHNNRRWMAIQRGDSTSEHDKAVYALNLKIHNLKTPCLP